MIDFKTCERRGKSKCERCGRSGVEIETTVLTIKLGDRIERTEFHVCHECAEWQRKRALALKRGFEDCE